MVGSDPQRAAAVEAAQELGDRDDVGACPSRTRMRAEAELVGVPGSALQVATVDAEIVEVGEQARVGGVVAGDDEPVGTMQARPPPVVGVLGDGGVLEDPPPVGQRQPLPLVVRTFGEPVPVVAEHSSVRHRPDLRGRSVEQ